MTDAALVVVPDRWAMLAMFAHPRRLAGPRPLRVLLPPLEYLDLLRAASPTLDEVGDGGPVELQMAAAVARPRGSRPDGVQVAADRTSWAHLLHPTALHRKSAPGASSVDAAVVHVGAEHLPLLALLVRWSRRRPEAAPLITPAEGELLLLARLHRAVILLDETHHSTEFPSAIERERVRRVPFEEDRLEMPW